MQRCDICGATLTYENDGSFISQFLDDYEMDAVRKLRKPICVTCKNEMLYAGIMAVI